MHTLRCITTPSADVLSSWAVPSLGVKTDAVPGRSNHWSQQAIQAGCAINWTETNATRRQHRPQRRNNYAQPADALECHVARSPGPIVVVMCRSMVTRDNVFNKCLCHACRLRVMHPAVYAIGCQNYVQTVSVIQEHSMQRISNATTRCTRKVYHEMPTYYLLLHHREISMQRTCQLACAPCPHIPYRV